MMNQGLIWLADNLRISYGDGGIIPLIRMIVKASNIYPLQVLGAQVAPMDSAQRLHLRWPRWYPLSADDRLKEAQAISLLTDAGQISRETAVKNLSASHNVSDIGAELAAISEDGE
jgi:hypothetical protein